MLPLAAVDAAAVGFSQLDYGLGGGRLARAALADEAERFAGVNVERNTLDRPDAGHFALDYESPLEWKVNAQVPDAQQWGAGWRAGGVGSFLCG